MGKIERSYTEQGEFAVKLPEGNFARGLVLLKAFQNSTIPAETPRKWHLPQTGKVGQLCGNGELEILNRNGEVVNYATHVDGEPLGIGDEVAVYPSAYGVIRRGKNTKVAWPSNR